MKALEIKNGDLVIGPGGYTTVSGAEKVRQDLSVAVREPYGSDRFHPRWGSILPEMIGGVIDEFSRPRVIGEVQRVVSNYIARQSDELMASATKAGRRPSFSSGEVVAAVESIDARQTYDRLHVRVIVRTLSGESVTLYSTVGV